MLREVTGSGTAAQSNRKNRWLGVLCCLAVLAALSSSPVPAAAAAEDPATAEQPRSELPVDDSAMDTSDLDVIEVMASDSAVLSSFFGPDETSQLATYEDVPAELARRMAVQEQAPESMRLAASFLGPDYGGGYIDTVTGDLVVKVVNYPASHGDIAKLVSKSGVRYENAIYSRAELEKFESVVAEYHSAGEANGASPIRLVGIDDKNNAVMVGVVTSAADFDAKDLGVPPEALRVLEMTEPEDQGAGEAGEKITTDPYNYGIPPNVGAQHCTLAASVKSYYEGVWFYYWLTAGHCKDGTAQNPNAKRFSHEGDFGIPVWQWQQSGSVDASKVWVAANKTSNSLSNLWGEVGPFASMKIKNYNVAAANTQWASVCFSGHGIDGINFTQPNYRCGYTFCADCAGASDQGGGVMLTLRHQFWWVPASCGTTTDGDSGGPLWKGSNGGVSLISVHRGGALVSGACSGGQTWVAMGSRLDRVLPALGVQLITG